MPNEPLYTVKYLKHSIMTDAEKKTETMTRADLVELLNNGMVTLLSAIIKRSGGE